MFIGHAAIAVLGGATRPQTRFLPIVLAAYGADILEIGLHAAGVPRPSAIYWSHSLAAVLSASVLAAGVTMLTWRNVETALLVGLSYASHWPADLLTGHGKGTWAGGPTVGFGLYERPALDFVVETSLIVLAALAYGWRRPGRAARIAVVTVALVTLQAGFNLGGERLKGLKWSVLRSV